MKTKEQHIDQDTHLESPFKFLVKQGSDAIVQNWYKARRFVLDRLNNTLQQ